MRRKLSAVLGAILINGLLISNCANAPKPLSYRAQIDIYKNMKIRLYKVASPIKISNVSMCTKIGIDNGRLTHSLSDYPENMQEVARSYLHITDQETILYEKQSHNISNCYAPVLLDYGHEPNAYTDGTNIYITPALLNQVDNLALSLIIAHELAHIARNHIELESSETLEQEADRLALFMLARTGLDYKKAALQNVASRQPHTSGAANYANSEKRAAYFRTVIAEIEKLETDGKALIP